MCHLCFCPEEDNEKLYRPMTPGWILLYSFGILLLVVAVCLVGGQ